MKIAIVGLSHQGYVWAIFLSQYYKNIGIFDAQKQRLSDFTNHNFPTYIKNEKDFSKYKNKLSQSCKAKSFLDLKYYDTILVTEDIIIKKDLTKDTIYLKKNVDQVIKYIPKNSNIILMSQVNIGSTRKIFSKILNTINTFIYYIPDVLTIGTGISSLENYKHVIVGGNKKIASNKEKNFLKKFFTKINKSFSYSTLEEAEIVKEAIQLKLSLDVTFVNLLSSVAEINNLSLTKMINFIKKDKRFSKDGYWRPGLGFGGGHIERGLKFFMDNLESYDKKFMHNLFKYNEFRINWLYKALEKNKKIKNIFIWGATYKKNTSSTFRSYTSRLIKRYKDKYQYTIYDPGLPTNSPFFKKKYVFRTSNQFMNLEGIDCLIILSDWDNFNLSIKEITKLKNFENLSIIDSYRILLPVKKNLIKMGIKYKVLGND
jgi:nucleotide sugar dehydrogenase